MTYDVLDVVFNDSPVSCGSTLRPGQASNLPSVYYSAKTEDKDFLLLMIDPDAPSADAAPPCGYWVHWMTQVKVGDDQALTQSGTGDLIEYNRPTPPARSGFHRYQMLLFPWPQGGVKSVPGSRGSFNLQAFLADNGLSFDDLLAAFEFIARNP